MPHRVRAVHFVAAALAQAGRWSRRLGRGRFIEAVRGDGGGRFVRLDEAESGKECVCVI